ncbi:MAG: hypothetical protein FWC92_07305 [Defluviitaleaceae bacterium]|nr:hypothetical protein [Defluviitaleaceae bacterium]
MDNHHIPTTGEENLAHRLSSIPEGTSPSSGLQHRYCWKSILLLSALAVVCVIVVLSTASLASGLSFVMAFPFSQIGHGLRVLSLSGEVGNAIAIVIFITLCLIPIVALLLIRKRKTEDALLILVSVVLFVTMYYMVNPGITRMATLAGPLEQALLGGMFYSLLLAYVVVRALRLFNRATAPKLGWYISIMLHLLNMLFVIVAFGVIFAQMLGAFAAFEAGNTTPGQQLGATYVFLVLHHITRALPYVLNVWVVMTVQQMLAALSAAPYSNETLAAAKKVPRICTVALTVSVLALAGFNLLQLMFASQLHVVNSNINFPVTPMLFVLGALLLTRYIAESKSLKDENDQFV